MTIPSFLDIRSGASFRATPNGPEPQLSCGEPADLAKSRRKQAFMPTSPHSGALVLFAPTTGAVGVTPT